VGKSSRQIGGGGAPSESMKIGEEAPKAGLKIPSFPNKTSARGATGFPILRWIDLRALPVFCYPNQEGKSA
jgi:hypothetical protein